MDAGFLRVTAVGRGAGGAVVRSVLYFPTDPCYRCAVYSGFSQAMN